jgi:RimJ/RimL family protein N-acetyltransferase
MLQSARLYLRPVTSADADAVALVYADPETMTTMPWRMLPTRALVDAWLDERIAELARTGYGMYVVTDGDGTVIGFSGFIPRGDRLELGWVVRKPYWGLGFATEAADAAFSTARDRDVFAAIRPGNVASIRVAEKIGLALDQETEDEHGPLLVYVNTPISAWEQHAGWWQREFTDGADPEYEEQILPLVDQHLAGARRVLDVGCGEGQVARRVAALGADVVGLDPTVAQLALAVERGGGVAYVRGGADALPYRAGVFDAVVMCLVIEHIERFDVVLAEIARVLAPGGRFLLMLNHPLLQTTGSGWIDDRILEEQYWRIGPYLLEDLGTEEVSPGVELPFMHRPLSRYVHVMGEVGLLIDDMDEPAPPPGFLALAEEYRDAAVIPRLMLIRARRVE